MTPPADPKRYKNHRFPGEIISHGVWLYYRFPLSYRDVQELLLEHGIDVTHEAIRQWCLKFGQEYANPLKRRRPRTGDKWHLDEVFVTINGKRHYLWRAVDQDDNVLLASWHCAGLADGRIGRIKALLAPPPWPHPPSAPCRRPRLAHGAGGARCAPRQPTGAARSQAQRGLDRQRRMGASEASRVVRGEGLQRWQGGGFQSAAWLRGIGCSAWDNLHTE